MRGKKLREWLRRRLKALREGEGGCKTVKEFAGKSKISLRHIYKLEEGKSSPTVEKLAEWLHACGTNLPTFFGELATESDREVLNGKAAIMDACEIALSTSKGLKTIVDMLVLLLPDETSRLEQAYQQAARNVPPGRGNHSHK